MLYPSEMKHVWVIEHSDFDLDKIDFLKAGEPIEVVFFYKSRLFSNKNLYVRAIIHPDPKSTRTIEILVLGQNIFFGRSLNETS